jgi:hypothetical protein
LVEPVKKESIVEEKATLFMALRNLKCEKRQEWSEGTDFVALDMIADEKVFLRLIDRRNGARFVGVDDVKNMRKAMRTKDCDRGFLVGRRFTDAATQEMGLCNIQQVSDDYMPPVSSDDIVLAINECINGLCTEKCGKVPLQESDCKGRNKENPCRVRSISDDVLFHFERGWADLLKNDLRQLLSMKKIVKA